MNPHAIAIAAHQLSSSLLSLRFVGPSVARLAHDGSEILVPSLKPDAASTSWARRPEAASVS
jgi:hypothetical protein